MPDISIEEALRRPINKQQKTKPLSIEEALAAPVVAGPATTPPGLGVGKNLALGAEQEVYGSLVPAAVTGLEALGAAMTGDFGPAKEIAEQAGRGAIPLIGALAGGPYNAGRNYAALSAEQAPAIEAISRQRTERRAGDPITTAVQQAAQEVEQEAALDPSLKGRVTRGVGRYGTMAVPGIVAGVTSGGSIPAVAATAALQSLNQPENMALTVALAATPIPIGKAVAPIVRRIRAAVGRPATELAPATVAEALEAPILPETPRISTETPLPGVEAPPALSGTGTRTELTPGQQEAAALNSAIRKLGTDSVDEIAEIIANSNRRFNKTISGPGRLKRPILPGERQSMREDYKLVSSLTKAENDALAQVLPERTFSPVSKMLIEGEPTARAISDIPLDEPSAQLDANLRELKAFFGSRDIVQESRIAAAVGSSADDLGTVKTADLGLDVSPVPVRPVDAVPVSRRVSVDDISLGRDTLSKGRMYQAQENLKGGVKAETKGVPLRQQVEPMTVVPDPQRPGKFIVEDDGNHRVALLKLQGVTDDIPVKSFETPAQTASITSAAGPRAGMVSPMEAEIGRQLDEIARPSVARNMEPLDVGSMERARQAPLLDVAPRRSALRRAMKTVADIYNIPRSMMSSSDLSFPFRQGAMFLVPPSRWRQSGRAMVEMFRALIPDKPTSIKGGIKAQFAAKTERYQRMVDAIASDLDAQTGMESGLKLTSQTGGFLRGKEEVFGSNIAERLPVVRESQQAYTMAADYTRLNTFKLYKRVLDKRAAQEGWSAEQIKDGYQRAAKWINIGSGRGNFAEKADRAMDALGAVIYSPRFLASRLQVLNPLTYLRNAGTPQGRAVLKLQMSELAQFTAMVGGTLFLAKQAGFKVGTSPENPDFLRLSLGNYHYDGLAGLQSIMRLVYSVAADAARAARGEKAVEGKTALDVAARFLRGKAAPIPSAFIDYFDRKTFEGKPFNLTDAAVERVMPMIWQDFIEAYQREGISGPFALAPGGLGFGAQYYEPKPIDAAIEQRPALLNELTRLQVRIADPRRKPGESDEAYKARSQSVADLYARYGVSLMSNRDYANLPEQTKQEVFDLLHSRITDAVNTRDHRTGQFQASQLINSLRKSARQKTIRQRLISRRPPL